MHNRLIITLALCLAAILAPTNCSRTDAQKQGGLSEESAQFLSQVQQDVKIRAFFPGGADAAARDVLLPYENLNKKISVEFIDPEKQQEVADKYDVTAFGEYKDPDTGSLIHYGTVVLETGERRERIEKDTPVNEEDVTNALARLIKNETTTIYFVEGHGEKRIANTDRDGYSIVVGKLKAKNYVIKTLNLGDQSRIPDEASVVVIAGPTSEPSLKEMMLLDAYLQGGGSVLLLVDPPPAPSLNEFTKKWSVEIDNDVVIDASGRGRILGAGPTVPLVTTYGAHRIAKRFRNVMTFYPTARSLAASPAATDTTVEPLVTTDGQGWGETTLKPPVTYDEKTDIKGSLHLALVATKKQGANTKSRLVVFGDSDFPINAYGIQQANMNLFIDTVTWLAEDQDFIPILSRN